MNRSALSLAAVTGALLLTVGATSAMAQPSPTGATHRAEHVCARPVPGTAGCHAMVVVDATGKPQVTATPNGYGPADIQSAYGLAGLSSGGRTVAIVDAYDDPTAEADLAAYRSQYGLPACTTANGCFRRSTRPAAPRFPRTDAGWAQRDQPRPRHGLGDLPDCHILLVEASSRPPSPTSAPP